MFLLLNFSSVFNFQIIAPKNIINTLSLKIHMLISSQLKPYFRWFFAGQEGIWQSFSLCSFSEMLSRAVWWKMKYKWILSMLFWNLIRMWRLRPILSYRISEYYPTFIPVFVYMCQMNCMGKEEYQLSQGSFHTLRNVMFSFRKDHKTALDFGISPGCFNMVQK